MECRFEDKITIIDCGKILTLESVQSQKNVFLQALAIHKKIIIHAEEVDSVDTASLQLLLSFTAFASEKK